MNRFLQFKAAFIAIISLLHFEMNAQDIHFSQFYASPLTLNPALTGHIICDWRAAGIYRDQWRTISPALMTAAASFDKAFYLRNHKIGGGAVLAYDRSGNADLSVTKIFLSGAYHKTFGIHALSGGLQMGFVDKRMDKSSLTFDDQWNDDPNHANGGTFDQGMPTADEQMGESLKYFDMNAGVVWSPVTEKLESQVGIAFFHITRPKESFYEKKEKLKARYVLHARLKWNATDRFYVQPNWLYQFHSASREFVLGSNFGYHLSGDKMSGVSIWAGPMFRYGLTARNDGNDVSNRTDALIAVIGAGFKNIDVGLAYDINMTDLKKATKHQGSFELSVVYTSCKPKLEKEQIPCDRL